MDVVGFGSQSLVVADIIYGAFDNGVIKGYIYRPSDPQPLFEDLGAWPSDAVNVTTAFKPIIDGWFLFELHH